MLGLLWQVVKVGIMAKINLKATPALINLLEEGDDDDEALQSLMALAPEKVLLKWLNYQLQRGGKCQKEVKNFGGDLKDGMVYAALFNALAPKECKSLYGEAQAETDLMARAPASSPLDVQRSAAASRARRSSSACSASSSASLGGASAAPTTGPHSAVSKHMAQWCGRTAAPRWPAPPALPAARWARRSGAPGTGCGTSRAPVFYGNFAKIQWCPSLPYGSRL